MLKWKWPNRIAMTTVLHNNHPSVMSVFSTSAHYFTCSLFRRPSFTKVYPKLLPPPDRMKVLTPTDRLREGRECRQCWLAFSALYLTASFVVSVNQSCLQRWVWLCKLSINKEHAQQWGRGLWENLRPLPQCAIPHITCAEHWYWSYCYSEVNTGSWNLY